MLKVIGSKADVLWGREQPALSRRHGIVGSCRFSIVNRSRHTNIRERQGYGYRWKCCT
jgi:hypothetical protein